MLLIAYSKNDLAGSGASKYLIELLRARRCNASGSIECFESDLAYIVGFDVDVIDLDIYHHFIDMFEAVIVLSRHKAESGRKTLSVHHTGNPTSEAHGGEPLKLGIAYPLLAWNLLRRYSKIAYEMRLDSYEITLEATHHGPTSLKPPIVFIEIGSTETEWRDEKAREAMARTVIDTIEGAMGECRQVAAIGGPHYPSRYSKASLESNICFGHIISKHSITDYNLETIIPQMITRNYPQPVGTVIVERKSLKRELRTSIEKIAVNFKVEIEEW